MNPLRLPRHGHAILQSLLLIYFAASLLHFAHNAEFLSDYPGLPSTWTRLGVYAVWAGMTAVGAAGWWLLHRGHARTGLLLVAAYALVGLDSLGHYVLAPVSAHTAVMNVTILLEVCAAALLLAEVARSLWRRWRHARRLSAARA